METARVQLCSIQPRQWAEWLTTRAVRLGRRITSRNCPPFEIVTIRSGKMVSLNRLRAKGLLCLLASLLMVAQASAIAQGDTRSSGVAIVDKALFRAEASEQIIEIAVSENTPGVSAFTSGTGYLDGMHDFSSISFRMAGGGFAQIRQIGKSMFVQDYSTLRQHQSGKWIRFSVASLTDLLNWPSSAGSDPVFLFAYSRWYSVIIHRIVAARRRNLARNGADKHYLSYFVDLRSIRDSKAGNIERPEFVVNLSQSNHLVSLLFFWPTTGSLPIQGGTTGKVRDGIFVRMSFRLTHSWIHPPRVPNNWIS